MESRRLPGSGAGPSPDRMLIGSEGSLGIITEAWLRLQERPTYRAGTAVLFNNLQQAVDAVRVICQAGLYPANVRLLDPAEAKNNSLVMGDKPSWCWLLRMPTIRSIRGWIGRLRLRGISMAVGMKRR